MNSKKKPAHLLIYLPLLALSGQTNADYKTDVGYTRLQNELGAAVPTGAGVKVTQVEASTVPDTDSNYPVFAPDPGAGSMSGKSFAYPGLTCGTPPCVPTVFSGHAMGVADRFYGNSSLSMAQGITDIHSYEANQWINTLYSSIDGSATTTDRRIASHSWAGSGNSASVTGAILRLVDRQVQLNEYLQVAATSTELLGNAYNVIAVGLTNGTTHGSGAVDGTYVGGRTRPDLVAPDGVLSIATPIVSAATAMLVQTGHTQPGLSLGSTTIAGVGTVYNAERSETIKAALMAGAERQTANTSGFGDITDYRSTSHQTANGLDDRYGAGQLNVYNSFHIIAGGEQNSLEDGGANNGQIGLSGFDYDPNFGGASGSNASATYSFTANADETLSAALVWNLDVSNDGLMTTNLHHLGLSLKDITANQTLTSSTSLLDNTQNLFWSGLIGGHDYQIQVASLQGATNWDYSLAWNRSLASTPVPVPASFWLFGTALASLFGYQRKQNRFKFVFTSKIY